VCRVLLSLSLLLTLLLAGCSSPEPTGPRSGGVLHLALRDAPPLSPFHDEDPLATPFLHLLYEGLVQFDTTASRVVPAHAERWEVSEDGLTYTFHLHAGRRYEDGRPILAADYVRSIETVFAIRPYSAGRARLWAVDGAISRGWRKSSQPELGVAAPDSHTVVFRLAARDPGFLLRLADPRYVIPQPADSVAAGGTQQPPASGPYRVERQERRLLFLRNTAYGGERPAWLDTISVRLGVRGRTLPALVARGAVDVVWPEPPGFRQRLQREEGLRIVTGAGEWRHYLLFNGSVPPTNLEEVRRAVASGYERRELPAPWEPWSALTGAAGGPVPLPEFDPDMTRQALEAVRRFRGLTLPVTVMRDGGAESLLESLAAGWALAGLHAEARPLAASDYWAALARRGGFQAALWTTRAPVGAPTPWSDLLLDRALDPSWGENLPHFFQGGEALDTLLLHVEQATGEPSSRAAENALLAWLADRLPILPIAHRPETAWVRHEVHDLRIHGAYGPLWEQVWRGQSPP
jgi:ABC-type transport system substrate-binding protein